MLLREILEFNARRNRDKPALIVEGEKAVTFGKLYRRAMRLATGLASRGQPQDHVAILADNCTQYVEAYYGVPAARQRLVFLNYRLTARELVRIVNDSEARVLLYAAKFADTVQAMKRELLTVERFYVIGDQATSDTNYEELFGDSAQPPMAGEDNERDVAWLIYTSGTTGMPKGAMLSHRNLVSSSLSAVPQSLTNSGEPRYLMPFPMCHVAGITIVTQHLLGVPVVLMKHFDAQQWLELVERHRITSSALAPTMLNMVLNHPQASRYDTSSIEAIGCGGSSIPIAVLRRSIERFGCVISQGFGMTESAGRVIFLDRDLHRRAAAGAEHLLGAAGRPGALASARIVDDNFCDCPPGIPGELVIKGDQVFSGYWQRPDVPSFRDGWFCTGDIARFDEDGLIYIVDRKTDMIVSGGENVYPREVEEILFAYPGVAEAVVFGVPDMHWGERVSAAIVTQKGQQVTALELTEYCRENLAGYKRPRSWHFVDETPKNTAGKVLKRVLRERFGSAEAG